MPLPWRKKPVQAASPSAAVRSVVEPATGVRAYVTDHDLGGGKEGLPCWVYRTDGLRKFNQKELVLAIRRFEGEPPGDPLMFFQAVANLASKGRLLDVGGYTEFGPRGMFGRADIHGIGYAPPHNMAHIFGAGASQDKSLALVLLTTAELETVRRCGLARVLALFGKAERFYPYPLWNDIGRGTRVEPGWLKASLASQFHAIVGLPACIPYMEEGRVVLRLSAEAAPLLAVGLRGAEALALADLCSMRAPSHIADDLHAGAKRRQET